MSHSEEIKGALGKMVTQLSSPVSYALPVGEKTIALTECLGQEIKLTWQGAIFCHHCGRKTKKSFNQGFCYPCLMSLPQCDRCIVSPEKCHYHLGTCRDVSWGDEFCMTDHIVYLANSSGLKVGVTRASQIPTRWIDQGATQAMPFVRLTTRYQAGLLEHALKSTLKDKTNWRAMLKGTTEPLDLCEVGKDVLEKHQQDITDLQTQFGIQAIQPIENFKQQDIVYPVQEYPTKVVSMSFDKNAEITGTLLGIKGQYLILDSGVLNIRKHTSYVVSIVV